MKNLEDTYGEQLLALLAGTLQEEKAQALRAAMARHPELQEAYDRLAQMDDVLSDLGRHARRNTPTIDVLDAVMGALPSRKAAEDLSDAEAAELMAYTEGVLDEVTRARFRKRLESEENLREALAGIEAMEGALSDCGRILRDRVPRIDVVSDVMSHLAPAASSSEEVELAPLEQALTDLGRHVRATAPTVDFKADVMGALAVRKAREIQSVSRTRGAEARLRASRRARTGMLVVAAAALVLVLLSVWVLNPGMAPPSESSLDSMAAVRRQSQDLQERVRNGRAEHREAAMAPRLHVANRDDSPRATTNNITSSGTPAVKPPSEPRPMSLREAQALRRQALIDEMKRVDFSAMASLTQAEALAVLEQHPITPQAVLGATQFLADEDAVAVLEEAIAQNPDNPYLQAALAGRYGDLDNMDAQLSALESWGALDPDNGLPLYEMANTLFSQGDIAGGMEAMRLASERPYASSYALDTARFHQAALEASGMDGDTARYFAASVAGTDEYNHLTALQQSLLAQGEALEAAGDLAGAADVYDAVRDLGQQVASGTQLPNVAQAGYETELAAVDYLAGIPEVLTPETLTVLGDVVDSLVRGLTQTLELTTAFDDMLGMADADALGDALLNFFNNGETGIPLNQ